MKSEPQRLTLGMEEELQACVSTFALCDIGTSPAVFVVTMNMYFKAKHDVYRTLTKCFCALT